MAEKHFSGFYVVEFKRSGPRNDSLIPDQKSSYLYEEREDDLEYVLDLVDLEDDLDEREDLDEEYLLRLGDREQFEDEDEYESSDEEPLDGVIDRLISPIVDGV